CFDEREWVSQLLGSRPRRASRLRGRCPGEPTSLTQARRHQNLHKDGTTRRPQPVVIRRNTIRCGDTGSVSMEPLVRYSQRTSMGRPN
ncbi:unnamed protein product, partial [Brassica oleracea]